MVLCVPVTVPRKNTGLGEWGLCLPWALPMVGTPVPVGGLSCIVSF